MKRMFGVLLSFFFLSSWAFAASGVDQFTLQDLPNGEITFNVNDYGQVRVSSGLYTNGPLFSTHEVFQDAASRSTTSVLAQVLIPTTTLLNRSTTYVAADFTQPKLPSPIEIFVNYGSGTAVVAGTTSWGQNRTETLIVSSGVKSLTNLPYLYVSSITLNFTGVSVDQSSVSFGMGISSWIGLANRISTATDVYAMREDHLAITSITVDTARNIVGAPSKNGTSDYDIWYQVRRTWGAVQP